MRTAAHSRSCSPSSTTWCALFLLFLGPSVPHRALTFPRPTSHLAPRPSCAPPRPPFVPRKQVYKKNQVPDPSLPPPVPGERPEFELTEVQQLLTDAFTGAAERHIEVGDGLDMLVIEKGEDGKGGAKMSWVNLRESGTPLDRARLFDSLQADSSLLRFGRAGYDLTVQSELTLDTVSSHQRSSGTRRPGAAGGGGGGEAGGAERGQSGSPHPFVQCSHASSPFRISRAAESRPSSLATPRPLQASRAPQADPRGSFRSRALSNPELRP